MKKWISAVMLVLFFALCLFPAWGHFLPGAEERVEGENRNLAQWPGADTRLKDWPGAVEDWFGDHLAFRGLFVRLSGKVTGSGGGAFTVVNNVARGKEGYLFYMADGSQDDILRRTRFSGGQLQGIYDAQAETARLVEEAEAQYVLMVCPDKHTVYPEYLPDALQGAEGDSRLTQSFAALEGARGVHIADLRPGVIGAKGEDTLYYKTDTHWNARGAWAGYRKAAETLADILPGFVPLTGADVEFGEPVDGFVGDMANMLGETPEDQSVPCRVVNPSAVRVESRYIETHPGDEARQIAIFENPDHPEYPRAVVFQDSFCEALKPFFAENFSRVLFVWSSCVRMDYVAAEKPDVVIMEYVERLSGGMSQMPMGETGAPVVEESVGLPKSTGRMRMCVDAFEQKEGQVSVTGWAFRPGRAASLGELQVALVRGEAVAYVDTAAVNRPDVTSYFWNELGDMLDGSGFTASFTTEGLKEGVWKVYVVLRGGDGAEDCIDTGKRVQVK